MKRLPGFLVLLPALLSAQPPQNYQLDADWHLDPASFKAEIAEDKARKTLTLSNGLLSRTIDGRLGTTVSFLNLMTGESLLRAVEPEGSLTIDGKTWRIGGAEGQPEQGLPHPGNGSPPCNGSRKRSGSPATRSASPPSGSGGSASAPPPRTPSGRRRGWPWPCAIPFPPPARATCPASAESATGRKALFTDDFAKADPSWEIHASKAHPRNAFHNEGKPGEIMALPDAAVFAERPLPEGAALVEAVIHPGTDTSASWGPGLALVYPDRTVKFHLRPAGLSGVNRPVLGIYDGAKEIPHVSGAEKIDLARPWHLRVRLAAGQLHFDARPEGGKWKRCHTLPAPAGKPGALRVGKMGLRGDAADGSKEGEPVRLRVERVAIYGPADPKALARAGKSRADTTSDLRVTVHYELYDGLPCPLQVDHRHEQLRERNHHRPFPGRDPLHCRARQPGRDPGRRGPPGAPFPPRRDRHGLRRLRPPERQPPHRPLAHRQDLQDPGQLQPPATLPPRGRPDLRPRPGHRPRQNLRDLPRLRAAPRQRGPRAARSRPAPDVPRRRPVGHREPAHAPLQVLARAHRPRRHRPGRRDRL